METESGAKIAIRGKGSVKEGKGRSDAAHASNQEEDLHCLIMADTEDKVNKAKKLIHNVIETVSSATVAFSTRRANKFQAASIPEGQNELKRNQLRELAALNGTLRDDENQACQNCGQIGHRKYDCPEKQNYTASIICRVCGNAGHMARDCPDRQRGQNWRNDGPTARPAGRIGGGEADAEYEVNSNTLYLTKTKSCANLGLSNSWQSSGAEQRLHASKLDLDLTRMGTPSHGSADLQEDRHPGDRVTRIVNNMMAVMAVEAVARVALLLGPVIAANGIMIVKGVMDTTVDSKTTAMEALLPLGPRLGIKPRLLEHSSSTEAILAATLDTRPWVLLPALEHLLPRRLTT